jgi:molecular chaperone GrpE
VSPDELPANAPAPSRGDAQAGAAPPQEDALREAEDRFLRLRADFENFRKRSDRERGEMRVTASAALIRDLLPVLDNLERAASHLPENCPEEFQRGLTLILQQLRGVFEQAGMRPVETEGAAFDPAVHEACAMVPTAALPPNHVVDVIQAGYTMGGKLLRPARVRVSAPPAADGGTHA